MLQPSDALSVGAEVAVTLTGFTGVVAVFGIGSVHEWSEPDRFRLQLLLSSSIMPLGLCLLGLLLLTTQLDEQIIWALCSATGAVFYLATGIRNLRRFRSIGIEKMNVQRGSNVVFLTSSLSGIVAILLQFYNLVVLRSFWPVYTLIVLSMMIALVQFARLILIQRS